MLVLLGEIDKKQIKKKPNKQECFISEKVKQEWDGKRWEEMCDIAHIFITAYEMVKTSTVLGSSQCCQPDFFLQGQPVKCKQHSTE